MKRILFPLGVLLPILLGSVARAVEIGDFKPFASKDRRFTAEFPGVPKPIDQAVDSEIGKMVAHLFIVRIGGEYEYGVNYGDLPTTLTEVQLKHFDADAGLAGTRDGVVRATKSKLIKESKITLDKWPGREWELEGTGDGKEDFLWRAYYVKTRQYQICVGWLKGRRPSKEILDKFLDSLNITAK